MRASLFYGFAGLAIIIAAEVLLFNGNRVVGMWFTPIVWTGYILCADAWVRSSAGASLLTTDRSELLIIVIISIAWWWIFEFYNAPRFWRSDMELWWHYHNLAPNPFVRRLGYDWAFATIFPAMFLTARLFSIKVFRAMESRRPLALTSPLLYVLIGLGAFTALLPMLFPSVWFAPLVWLSFIMLLDPVNFLRGWPSITGDLRRGSFRRLLSLLAGGGLCGILWEFWNYWALSKWTYTVPYLGNVKLFEMPVLGFLGFPPFAVECWVLYIFSRSLLTTRPLTIDEIWFESND